MSESDFVPDDEAGGSAREEPTLGGCGASFDYTNHRGERMRRRVCPVPGRGTHFTIYFGSCSWHTDHQWLMDAFDLDRNAVRTFAVSGISGWKAESYHREYGPTSEQRGRGL